MSDLCLSWKRDEKELSHGACFTCSLCGDKPKKRSAWMRYCVLCEGAFAENGYFRHHGGISSRKGERVIDERVKMHKKALYDLYKSLHQSKTRFLDMNAVKLRLPGLPMEQTWLYLALQFKLAKERECLESMTSSWIAEANDFIASSESVSSVSLKSISKEIYSKSSATSSSFSQSLEEEYSQKRPLPALGVESCDSSVGSSDSDSDSRETCRQMHSKKRGLSDTTLDRLIALTEPERSLRSCKKQKVEKTKIVGKRTLTDVDLVDVTAPSPKRMTLPLPNCMPKSNVSRVGSIGCDLGSPRHLRVFVKGAGIFLFSVAPRPLREPIDF